MHLVVKSRHYKESMQSTLKGIDPELRDSIEKISIKKGLTMSSLIRSSVLRKVENNPLLTLPEKPPENSIHLLSQVSPDALVYQAPSSNIKIVVAPTNNGWRGIIFNPLVVGSLDVWNSENINVPSWAKTKNIFKTMMFLCSRIDNDGSAYFDLPNSDFFISAKFENGRWNSGKIVNGKTKKKVPWIRQDHMSIVDCSTDPLRWGTNRNIRRYLSVLTGALRCGDGGIEKQQ